MSEIEGVLADLDTTLSAAQASELPAVVGQLETLRAKIWRRILATPVQVPVYLSVEEASNLAKLPRKRIWSLSRSAGCTWAVRLGKKQLKVEKHAFLLFLRRHVAIDPETS